MKIIIFLLITLFLNAGILDFWHIKEAKSAYESKDFKKAASEYKELKGDRAKYNLANSYYKLGEYKKSIRLYNEIKDKNLEFKKLHNLGNAYANSGEIKKAIESYEKALKIKKDKDTKYNLDLLRKKQQQNKKNKKNKKQNKKNQNKKKQQNKKQNKDSNKNKNSNNNQKDSNKNKDSKQQKNQNSKQKKNKEKKQNAKQKQNQIKKIPLSNMQERKYIKMLNKRGVNTLLLPLNKKSKGENSEENPW